jgi:negative regulator of flagellin synthesis FlgM
MAVYWQDRCGTQGCTAMVEPVGVKGAANDRAVARVLEARAVQATPAPTSPPAAPGADVARLSGLAAELAARPPVDGDRVQQIRKAIANGTFPILPATVADRLLAVRYEWLDNDAA